MTVTENHILNIRALFGHEEEAFHLQALALLQSLPDEAHGRVFADCTINQGIGYKGKPTFTPRMSFAANQICTASTTTSTMLEGFFSNPKQSWDDIRDLHLNGFTKLNNVNFASYLPNLRRLVCTGCSALRNIDGLTSLTKLEDLQFGFCQQLSDLRPLQTLPRLLYLRMPSTMISDADLSPLRGHPKLVELHLASSSNLMSLHSIADMPRLIKLDLSSSQGLTSLLGLQNLPRLRELLCARCDNLENIDAIAGCQALKILDVSTAGCWEPDFNMYMYGHHSLSDISSLFALENLQRVNIRNQTKVPKEQREMLKSMAIPSCNMQGCEQQQTKI